MFQVIQTHFWIKRKEIKSQIEAWISDMESQSADRRTGRAISLNTIALKVRVIGQIIYIVIEYCGHSISSTGE